MRSQKSSISSIHDSLTPSLDSRHFLAKRSSNIGEILAYERVLAEGLRGFLNELVMVNGGVVVSYISSSQHANLGDIIGSSTEIAIKPGRLFYRNHAQVEFDWGEVPSVTIAMELRDERLTAFFGVVFGRDYVGVDISGIHFVDRLGDAKATLELFADAVADARLPPREIAGSA